MPTSAPRSAATARREFSITAKALLDREPHPSRERICEALSGNLCRCTGYLQIVEAVEAAARTASPPAPRAAGPAMSAPLRVVGRPRRRVDGRAKVTGQTRFADDIMLPRMLHCRLLRSTQPHARIVSIDVSKAASIAGVHLVLTGDEFPIPYGILPVSHDEHALCRDKVRFVGDPVAAVIARDEQTAERGARPDRGGATSRCAPSRLRTTACVRPSRASTTTATTATCTRPWRCSSATSTPRIAAADHVFDDVFFFEGNTHLPIEQHATVALKDPDGKLVVYSSTQTPHYLHRALAKALAMPAAHIRVVATPNGGGFGGKSDPFNHEIVVAKAALLLDRPVKICLTREEVFLCHRGRHPVLMRFRTGVTKDGKIAGHAICRRCSTAAPMARTAWRARSTPVRCRR